MTSLILTSLFHKKCGQLKQSMSDWVEGMYSDISNLAQGQTLGARLVRGYLLGHIPFWDTHVVISSSPQRLTEETEIEQDWKVFEVSESSWLQCYKPLMFARPTVPPSGQYCRGLWGMKNLPWEMGDYKKQRVLCVDFLVGISVCIFLHLQGLANIWSCLVIAKPVHYEGPLCPAPCVAKWSSLNLGLCWDVTCLRHEDSAWKICSCLNETYWGRKSCLIVLLWLSEKSCRLAKAPRSAAAQHP